MENDYHDDDDAEYGEPVRRSTRTSRTSTRTTRSTVNTRGNGRGAFPTPSESREGSQRPGSGHDVAHPMDAVPLPLAQLIVNMQEQYAADLSDVRAETRALIAEVRALRAENQALEAENQALAATQEAQGATQEQLKRDLDASNRRQDVHVVLMDGLVHLYTPRNVRPPPAAPEAALARALGGDHMEAVEGLLSLGTGGVSNPIEEPQQLPGPLNEALNDHPLAANPAIPPPAGDDELPPPPSPDAPAVISTGRRAPKRRNLGAATNRRVKRRQVPSQPTSSRSQPAAERPAARLSATTRIAFRGARRQNFTAQPRHEGSESEHSPERLNLRPRRSWRAINEAFEEDDSQREVESDYEPETDESQSDDEPQNDDEVQSEDEFDDVSGESSAAAPDSTSPSRNPDPQPDAATASAPATVSAPPTAAAQPANRPRYNRPRSTGTRYAVGPPGRPFKYIPMPKTVALVYQQYKVGLGGNDAIEELERRYNTTWRGGSTHELKYGSNYKAVRKMIVDKAEEMAEQRGVSVQEACRLLDERTAGRMTLLKQIIKAGKDPMVDMPPPSRAAAI